MFLKPTVEFQFPADRHVPILMIGPGTGVTPFRSLLSERAHLATTRHSSDESEEPISFGATWLFFGCRHPGLDFLFRDDWTSFADVGVLTKFDVAFSRVCSVLFSCHSLFVSAFYCFPLFLSFGNFFFRGLMCFPVSLFDMIPS